MELDDPYDDLPELEQAEQTQPAMSVHGARPPPYSERDTKVPQSAELPYSPAGRHNEQLSTSNLNLDNSHLAEVQISSFNKYEYSDRSLVTAYILAAGLGFFGAHHFYMKRPRFGVLYIFTLGIFGLGWLTDLCRLPFLVKRANSQMKNPETHFSGPEDRDIVYAYVLWLPLGLLGAHQYYLRRWKWAVLYTFTLGLFGIGWLIDVARMPCLSRDCNKRLEDERNHVRQHGPRLKTLTSAYLLAIPPIGILGAHHYYLNRKGFGIVYTLTGGLFFVGWLADLVRMKWLVRRVNKQIQKDYSTASEGQLVTPDKTKYLDDAYILQCSPFGILGAGQFYLHRYGWAVGYIFTGGFLTVGWFIDMFRLSGFVRNANRALESQQNQVRIRYGANTQIIVVTDGQIVAGADTGSRPPVVIQGSIAAGPESVPGEEPPSYDSVLAETTTPGGAAGGPILPRDNDLPLDSKQHLASNVQQTDTTTEKY